MSIDLTIRNKPAELADYRYIVVTLAAAPTLVSGANTAITVDNASIPLLKKVKSGMRLLNADDLSTHNKIISVVNDTITVSGNSITGITGLIAGSELYITTVKAKGLPLTNAELDSNFLELEKNKLAADGSQDVVGDLQIKSGSNTDGDLTIDGTLSAKSLDLSTATGLAITLGDGDIEASTIVVSGGINDSSLFDVYSITAFEEPLILLANDDGTFKGTSVLYLNSTSGVQEDATLVTQTPIGDNLFEENKQIKILKVNSDKNYIIVEELDDAEKDYGKNERLTTADDAPVILKSLKTNKLLKSRQNVSVFGIAKADTDSQPTPPPLAENDVGAVVATFLATQGTPNTTYKYRIAEFSRDTGKLTEADTFTTNTFQIGTGSTPGKNVSLDQFSETTYNRISSANRSNTNNNVLIYRATNSFNDSDFKLIAVLGEDEMAGQTQFNFTDYGNFITNEWANKNELGEYDPDTGLSYLPITWADLQNASAQEIYKKGISRLTVDSVSADNTVTFVETLSTTNAHTTKKELEFYHDNSTVLNASGELIGGIEYLLNTKKNKGETTVTIPDGTYYTNLIKIPNGIKIQGSSKQNTVLKAHPWHTSTSNAISRQSQPAGDIFSSTPSSYSHNMIILDDSSKCTLSNITLDGNFINQVKFQLTQSNVLVRVANSTDLTFDNVKIQNVVSGAVLGQNTKYFTIANSQIQNGAVFLTGDQDNLACPLHARDSSNLKITSSTFENFNVESDLAGLSVGVLLGNVIRNSGAGVLVYGSTNTILSPNLILGSSNEFIGAVDTFDSEYDSINIDLTGSGNYVSESINFLRDGENLYLSSLPEEIDDEPVYGTEVTIRDNFETVVKDGVKEYFIDKTQYQAFSYSSLGNKINVTSAEEDLATGNFQFEVTAAGITDIRNVADHAKVKQAYQTHRSNYSNLYGTGNALAGETLVGLIYELIAKEYKYIRTTEAVVTFNEISLTVADAAGTLSLVIPSTDTFGNVTNDININSVSIGDKIILKCPHASTDTAFEDDEGIDSSVADKIFITTSLNPDLVHEVTNVNRATRTITISINTEQTFNVGDVFSDKVMTSGNSQNTRIGVENEFIISKGIVNI